MDKLPLFMHIDYPNYHVYISQSPTNDNIEIFINQINNNKIKHVVRLCEPLYDSKKIHKRIVQARKGKSIQLLF